MRLNTVDYDHVLAWASGEADRPSIESGSSRVDAVAALWQRVESLVRSDDAHAPDEAALVRAAAIPSRISRGGRDVRRMAARVMESVHDLIERIDGVVALLVHDDRHMPIAVRGDVGQVIHMAWEAGDLDIDLVAEAGTLDPLTGIVSRWVLRGEVMADVEVGGLEVSLIDPRDGLAVETAALDPFGRFVMEAESGSWSIRVGLDSRGLHLEPVELG